MYNSPFLQSIYEFMLSRRYSKRTIRTYIYWIKAFILYHGKQHPKVLNDKDVARFLSHLAVNRSVASSTQRLALNALAFLYNRFLEQPLGSMDEFTRSKRQTKLPTVLSQDEIKQLFLHISPKYKLIVGLLYGSGLRRIECLRLRVNDIDESLLQIRIWNGKGFKHRLTTLAPLLIPAIKRQIALVNTYLEEDLSNPDYNGVWLPDALSRKYRSANKALGWHYLFPS